jgi:hypothetical protein
VIGNGYWSTGITVRYGYSGMNLYGWGAEVKFYDDGWAGDDNADTGAVTTQGILSTRYCITEGTRPDADGLSAAVDAVKRDAERLGITWKPDATIFYERDGQGADYPPPDGWRGMVSAQAQRLGWEPIYGEQDVA